MKIGILQTGEIPEEIRGKHGDYPQLFMTWLADSAFTFETYEVLHHHLPTSPQACDAWLITGSKHGAYEDHGWIPPLEDLIRGAFEAKIPLVGICFGHQIIAQALGGTVEKFARGWSVGVKDYAMDDMGAAGESGNLKLNAFHQDQVITPPSLATLVGTTPFCHYAALRYGDLAYSIQPHPEFTKAFMTDLINARRDLLPETVTRKALASLEQPLAADRVASFIKDFLKRAVATKRA